MPAYLSDLTLARRLERTEAHANRSFVEVRACVSPESGACWTEVAGAYAMYDGVRSPLTQTFGLGIFDPVGGGELDTLEAFFQNRGAPVMHEVSPLADKSLPSLLSARGYQPVEFTSVMYLPLAGWAAASLPRSEGLRVRVIQEDERELWARTAAEGWRELTDIADLMMDLLRLTASRADSPSFLAELNGRAVAAGGLCLHGGVALLAGASTIPEARRQGAQRALLASRLGYAAEAGCDLAMMCAEPGSASQRNAERQGFRIAYTRIKWGLRPSGG